MGKTLKLNLRQKEQILNKDKPGKMMYLEVKSVSTKVGPGQISNETNIKEGQDEDKRWDRISNIQGQTKYRESV